MLIWRAAANDREELEALAAPAIGTAECLLRDDGAGGLILCDEGSAPDGVAEARCTRTFTAGTFGPEAGPWIFAVGIRSPVEWREELCGWYRCEHGPLLLECREWRGFQFLESPAPDGCQFHVLHRLASRAALDSDARKASRATPWFRRLAQNSWFDAPFERVLARRVSLLWHPSDPRDGD
jgi:hypothetical protein